MAYFKIIQDDKIVSVSHVFLKWNEARKNFHLGDTDKGQFVLAFDESKVYRDEWMKPIPEEANGYEHATVQAIDEAEYEDLKALLSEGEQVQEDPEPVVQEPIHVPEEPEEEKPMSIAEMREIIKMQQKQIEALMETVANK